MESIAQVYGVVYAITNDQSDGIYIGQTTQVPLTRWGQHRSELGSDTHGNQHLKHAWKKYGETAFTFTVLETANSQAELNELEAFYIDYLRYCGANLYNFKLGGHSGKRLKPRPPISEETRRKRSEALKSKGIRPSPEAAEKARLLSIGRAKSPETIAKWKASDSTGVRQTPEYRQRMSEQKKGVKLGPYRVTDKSRAKWEAQRHPEDPKKTERRIAGMVANQPIRIFRSPDGVEHSTRNIAAFAREHGLSERQMCYVAAGTTKHHRGWTFVSRE